MRIARGRTRTRTPELNSMNESIPDLVRLTVPIAFLSLAIDDYHSRRVASSTWPPLAGLGTVLLAIDAYHALTTPKASAAALGLRVAVSVLAVGGLGIALFAAGAFGGADAKALVVLSILLPTTPVYSTSLGTFPMADPPLGVLSLAVVSNSILLAGAYPVALAARNLLAGHVGWRSFVARPARAEELPELHGQAEGLDLDILRAYLDWSDTPVTEVERVDEEQAAEFLSNREGPRYGATPTRLCRAVNAIAGNKTVWVTPGIPFLVPVFAGVVTALTIGDLLAVLEGFR